MPFSSSTTQLSTLQTESPSFLFSRLSHLTFLHCYTVLYFETRLLALLPLSPLSLQKLWLRLIEPTLVIVFLLQSKLPWQISQSSVPLIFSASTRRILLVLASPVLTKPSGSPAATRWIPSIDKEKNNTFSATLQNFARKQESWFTHSIFVLQYAWRGSDRHSIPVNTTSRFMMGLSKRCEKCLRNFIKFISFYFTLNLLRKYFSQHSVSFNFFFFLFLQV